MFNKNKILIALSFILVSGVAHANTSGGYDNGFTQPGSPNEISISSSDGAQASSANSAVAIGNGAVAGPQAVAIGTNATASMNSGSNSVALGTNSVANRANSVSVGNASSGLTRQITNVSGGTAGTDAVNLSQMQSAVQSAVNVSNAQITSVINGVAAASAASSAATVHFVGDNKNAVAVGVGTFGGESAAALSFGRKIGSSGVISANLATMSGGQVSAGAGASWSF